MFFMKLRDLMDTELKKKKLRLNKLKTNFKVHENLNLVLII